MSTQKNTPKKPSSTKAESDKAPKSSNTASAQAATPTDDKARGRSDGKKGGASIFQLLGGLIGMILLGVVGLLSGALGGGSGDFTTAPRNTPQPLATLSSGDTAPVSTGVQALVVGQGFGFREGFWDVYFTAPTGSRDPRTYTNGIDSNLALRLATVTRTLDIAAFELNSPVLTQAILDARRRGVTVRIITDDEHGTEDEDTTLGQLTNAGVRVIDDQRSALMHNKFMILDGVEVWAGSWNYTINDTYRNNNSAVVLRDATIAALYQAEFNEMFEQRRHGPRSPSQAIQTLTVDGTRVTVYFAPEDAVVPAIIAALQRARRSIRFMAFSFTIDEIANVMAEKKAAGLTVQGIFESTGSEQEASELPLMFCNGIDVRQDGTSFFLHHKVMIIDNNTVIVGSFNFSANATNSNDENMLIIQDSDLGRLYRDEFNRRWSEALAPSVPCR
jgi:phosphatidylserine/phosphatidylglycerophosphate/cardiolipin synthase-like enzyme